LPTGSIVFSKNASPDLAAIRQYNYLVRVKTSVTLKRAARTDLLNLERQARDRRDTEIINRVAERLNREAKDTLDYQQLP
jgi:hypothetical protein